MPKTLTELRKESPYTAQQVADYMNVTRKMIYLWEKGKSPITAQNLYKLLTLYGQSEIKISDIHYLIPIPAKS